MIRPAPRGVFPLRFRRQAKGNTRHFFQCRQKFLRNPVPRHLLHRPFVAFEKRGVLALHYRFPKRLRDREPADKKRRDGHVVVGRFVVKRAGRAFGAAHTEGIAGHVHHVGQPLLRPGQGQAGDGEIFGSGEQGVHRKVKKGNKRGKEKDFREDGAGCLGGKKGLYLSGFQLTILTFVQIMGASNIQVSFPGELVGLLDLPEGELAPEMLRLALVKLFELGKISSGQAAQLLGLSRVSFLELAGAYQVSILGNPDAEQLRQDLLNA